MPTVWNNQCAYLDYCNSFYFPFRSKKDYFEHCFSCSTKSSLWILDIMFSVNLHMQELLTLPTGRNILYENFYCQWELAVTFWFCIKYIYLILAKVYLSGTELCLRVTEFPAQGNKELSRIPVFLHLPACELLSHVNTSLLCSLASTTRIGHRNPTQNPDLSLMVSIISRYWIEFQAANVSSCWSLFSLCWTAPQLTNLRYWCHIWIARIDPRKPSGRADAQSEQNRPVTRQGKPGSFKIKQNIFWVLNVTHPFSKARASLAQTQSLLFNFFPLSSDRSDSRCTQWDWTVGQAAAVQKLHSHCTL